MSQPDMFLVIDKITSKDGAVTMHVSKRPRRKGAGKRIVFPPIQFAPPTAFKKPIHATHWDYSI